MMNETFALLPKTNNPTWQLKKKGQEEHRMRTYLSYLKYFSRY